MVYVNVHDPWCIYVYMNMHTVQLGATLNALQLYIAACLPDPTRMRIRETGSVARST